MPAKPREHHAHASRTGAPHTHPPRVPPVSLSTAAPTGEIPPALVLWRGGCARRRGRRARCSRGRRRTSRRRGSEHEMSTRESWRVHARLAERRREGAARARERVLAAEVVLVVGGEGADVAEPDRRARGGARARRLGRVGGGAVRRALVAEDAAAVAAVVRPPHQVERPLAEHAREHEVLGQPRLLRVPRVVRRERRLAQLVRPVLHVRAARHPRHRQPWRRHLDRRQLRRRQQRRAPLLGGAAGASRHRGALRRPRANLRDAGRRRRAGARGSSRAKSRVARDPRIEIVANFAAYGET